VLFLLKILRKKPMFFNQGTSQPEASQEKVNGDMASVWEELDDVQLATVVGGAGIALNGETQVAPVLTSGTWEVEIRDNGTSWIVEGKGLAGSGKVGGETTL
jgi:hypothetical protein